MHIRIWNSERANLDDEHTGLQREQHQEDKILHAVPFKTCATCFITPYLPVIRPQSTAYLVNPNIIRHSTFRDDFILGFIITILKYVVYRNERAE